MSIIQYINYNVWASNLVQSLILIFILFFFRWSLRYALENKKKISIELKLKWKIQIRNITLILLIVGLIIIWATELRTLAISLVAVAVALIIATKELIMCFTGSFFKLFSDSFSLGDHIIIGEYRGEVIDQTLISTTLMEIGPGKNMHQHTGRAITLPNSIFVNTSVINESFQRNYVLHAFSVPIEATPHWQKAEEILLELATKACSSYFDEAKRQLLKVARKKTVDVPRIEPKVTLTIEDTKSLILTVRLPAPIRQRGIVEQEIVRGFLKNYTEELQEFETAESRGAVLLSKTSD